MYKSGPNSKSFVRFLSPNADRGEQGRLRERAEGRGSAWSLPDEPLKRSPCFFLSHLLLFCLLCNLLLDLFVCFIFFLYVLDYTYSIMRLFIMWLYSLRADAHKHALRGSKVWGFHWHTNTVRVFSEDANTPSNPANETQTRTQKHTVLSKCLWDEHIQADVNTELLLCLMGKKKVLLQQYANKSTNIHGHKTWVHADTRPCTGRRRQQKYLISWNHPGNWVWCCIEWLHGWRFLKQAVYLLQN